MARTYALGGLGAPGIVALSLQTLQVFVLIILLYIICIAFRRRLTHISRQSLSPFVFLGLAIICRQLCITLSIVDSCLSLVHASVKFDYSYMYSCFNTLFVVTKVFVYWSIILIFENRLGLLTISPIRYRTFKSWHRMLMVVLVLISLAYIVYNFMLETAYIKFLGDESDNQLDHVQVVTNQVNGIFLGYSSIYIVEALYICGIAFYIVKQDVLTKSLRSILLTATVFLFIHEAYYFADAVILNLPSNNYAMEPISIILPEVFNFSLVACIAFLAYLLQPISQGLEDWELGKRHLEGPRPIEINTISKEPSYEKEQVQQLQHVDEHQQSFPLPPLPVQTTQTSLFYNLYQPNEPSPLKVVSTIPRSPHHSGEYSQCSSNRNSSILFNQQLQVHITGPTTHTRRSSAYQESRTSVVSSRHWSWQSEGQFTVRPVPTTTTTTTSPLVSVPVALEPNITPSTMARPVDFEGNSDRNGNSNRTSDGGGDIDDASSDHQKHRHSIVTAVPRPTWHYQVQEMTRPTPESTTIERWSGDRYA